MAAETEVKRARAGWPATDGSGVTARFAATGTNAPLGGNHKPALNLRAELLENAGQNSDRDRRSFIGQSKEDDSAMRFSFFEDPRAEALVIRDQNAAFGVRKLKHVGIVESG